jgi:cold shock protein
MEQYLYLLRTLRQINIITMSKGTVKFFNDSKGFGFIKDEASEKEYFVHVSGLNDEIRENDEVTFDLQEGKKGLNAVNVKLV